MKRRAFMAGAAASAAAMAACRLSPWAGEGRKPSRLNILLVTSDDQGPHLSCLGDPHARTPNIDALAADGVLFQNAWVTQTSCAPSRASIFTGLYPHEHGQVGLSHLGYRMKEGMAREHFPALLRDAGYYSGVIGKVHSEPEESFAFDLDMRGFILPTRDVRAVAGHARDFLQKRPTDRPFFLMVNLFDPHRPYEGGDEFNDVLDHPLKPGDVPPFGFLGEASSPALLKDMASYYNGVARIDWCVGALMKLLKEQGVTDETLVVFLGDHGPPFTRAKTTCYEAGLHIPMVVRWPGLSSEPRKELISAVDLYPTILEAAGIDPPGGRRDARSLRPLLEGRSVPWREGMAAEFTAHTPWLYYPRRAWRTHRWKLIHNLLPGRENPVRGIDDCPAWEAAQAPHLEGTPTRAAFDRYDRPPEFELYDLQNDPDEFVNLAGRSEHAEIERELKSALLDWQERTNDPLLDPQALAELTEKHDAVRRKFEADPASRPRWDG